MTSKEKLALIKETWYDVDLTDEKYIDFDEEQTFSDLEKDLNRLEQIDNANPSEALKILETFNGGLLNKEIGAIMYNQIWLKNQIEALKKALLKAQEQDKILEILKELFKYKGNYEWLFHYLENEEQKQLIKEWLDGKD